MTLLDFPTIQPIRSDDPDALEALRAALEDPDAHWYARRVLPHLIAAATPEMAALVAAWNPLLHPRGPDGRFIKKFGWVKWLDGLDWNTGFVSNIDGKNGNVTVMQAGKPVTFTREAAQKKLYARPKPKAKLKLPSLGGGKTDGYTKIGGQGGSNPGGLFQVDTPGMVNSLQIDRMTASQALADLTGIAAFQPITPDGYPKLDPKRAYIVPKIDGGDGVDVIYTGPNGGLYRVGPDDIPLHTPDGGLNDEFQVDPSDVFGAPDSPRRKALLESPDSVQMSGVIPTDDADGVDLADSVSGVINGVAASHPALGDEFYVKKANKGDPADRAQNEALANFLYEFAGTPVPEVSVGDDGQTVASKIVSAGKFDPNNPAHVKAARSDFLFDAWLANWDAVGLSFDNMKVDDEGRVWRIDAGGALRYRAMGSPKGDKFGSHVGELSTMRDKNMNGQAAKVYGDVTDAELKEQAERLAAISPDDIRALVAAHHQPDHVADTLIARRQDIFDQLGLQDMLVAADDLTVAPPPETVFNPVTNETQPGKPPAGAVQAFQWQIDNIPTVSADFNLKDMMDGGVFRYEGRLIYMEPGSHSIDPDGAIFTPLDLATGERLPDVERISLDWLTPVDWVTDDEAEGGILTASSGRGAVIGEDLAVARDLAIAEWVDQNRKLSETAMTAPEFGVDNPPSLPAMTQLLMSADDVNFAVGNKIPLYNNGLNGGLYEIVESDGDMFVTLRTPNGNLSTYTKTELADGSWERAAGAMEPLWRARIEDRNVGFKALNEPPTPPAPKKPTVDIPDVPSPPIPDSQIDPDIPETYTEPDKPSVVLDDSPVHSSLKPISEPISLKDVELTDEKVEELSAEWVGKTVFIASETWPDDPDAKVRGVLTITEVLTKEYGGYYDKSDRLLVRGTTATGDTVGFYMTPSKKFPNSPQYTLTELDMDMGGTFKITKKKNGDLAVGSTVIGKWAKTSYYYGTVEVTVFPEYSVTGKTITGTYKSKTKTDGLEMFINPNAVPKKAIKKTPETVALEKGYKKAPTAGTGQFALADGTPAVKGQKVYAVAGTGDMVEKSYIVEGTYGHNEIIVKPVDGGELSYIKASYVISQPAEGENWLVSSHAVKDANGDWIGTNYKVDVTVGGNPEGGGTVITAYPVDGTVLVRLDTGERAIYDQSLVTKQAGQPSGVEILYTKDDFAAIAAQLTAPKVKKQKIGESSYRAPDGSTIPKNQAAADQAVAKGWKVTQDGYAPTPGMILRRPKDDTQWVVEEVVTYGSSEGKIKVRQMGGSYWDTKTYVPSSFEVDHAAMLTDENGAMLPKIATIEGTGGGVNIPNGSIIYHRQQTKNSYGSQRGETTDEYYALTPNGSMINLATGKSHYASLAQYATKVGFTDDTGGKKITVTTADGAISGFAITDKDIDGNKTIAKALAENAGDSPTAPIPYTGSDIKNAKLPHPPVKSTAPPVPSPTLTTGDHLKSTGSAPGGAQSITDAIDRTIRLQAAGDREWTTSYGIADGDVIEDMHVSTQVVESFGEQFVEVRFRLDGDAAQAIRTQLTGQDQEFGDWTPELKGATELVDGDKISLRVGHGGILKPSATQSGTEPNATVVGTPKLLGTSAKGFDVHQFQVALANGETAWLNLEDRGAPTVSVLTWDEDKPRAKVASSLTLSGSAVNAGWTQKSDEPGFEYDSINSINGFSIDGTGVKKVAGDWKASGGEGRVFGRDVDGAAVTLTSTSAGRNVQDGRVTIRVPVDDPDAALKIARAMEAVGVTPEQQQPPDTDKLAKMALNKVYAQFSEHRTRGDRSTATLQNPQSALALIDKAIGKELGRPATLNDIEFQVLPDGQMRTRVSRDIAAAIVKKNKATHYVHGGTGKFMLDSLLGRTSGILSAQQRAENGIYKSGAGTIATDNRNGGGDRVFAEARTSATISASTYGARGPIFDPIEQHRNLDYWYRSSDSFGSRFGGSTPSDSGYNWDFLKLSHAGAGDRNEFLFKHGAPTETWAGVLVGNKQEKDEMIEKLKAAGKFKAPNGMSWDDFIRVSGQTATNIPGSVDGDSVGTTVPIGQLL